MLDHMIVLSDVTLSVRLIVCQRAMVSRCIVLTFLFPVLYGFLLDNSPHNEQNKMFNSQYTGNGESK
jgi:hypothetical protein